jgi:energy-coupling factor transporter transmembrane protein EcfT
MSVLKGKKEFIHSWYLLVMTFFSLIFLLASGVLYLNLVLALFMIYLFLKNGMKTSTLKKLIAFAFFFSFMFLLLNLLYPAQKYRTGDMLYISSWGFYKLALMNGLHTFAKLFLLSLVSMASSYAIVYTKVILYLIIHKGLKVFWGYPILIALNSILLFKDELDRIRLSARFRSLGWWDRLFVLFPLLVFAIRHSQRGSLSLVTRGLNPSKSFYFGYSLEISDWVWMKIFIFGYISLVAIAIIFR